MREITLDRDTITALIDQLCRDLPAGDTAAADDFDYGWFRERTSAIATRFRSEDAIFVWQYALWKLEVAGLLPDDLGSHFKT
ncbi:MAG TPA: hypothetical protein VGC74_05480 [Stenotrophomonas sp.]